MVFFFIAYLLIISLFCLPFGIKIKAYINKNQKNFQITISNLIDIFPNRNKKDLPIKARFTPNKTIFNLIKLDKLSVKLNNLGLMSGFIEVFVSQIVFILKINDSLDKFETLSTKTLDGNPSIQIYLHAKINLFMIFSSIFKIIKIERGAKNESR